MERSANIGDYVLFVIRRTDPFSAADVTLGGRIRVGLAGRVVEVGIGPVELGGIAAGGVHRGCACAVGPECGESAGAIDVRAGGHLAESSGNTCKYCRLWAVLVSKGRPSPPRTRFQLYESIDVTPMPVLRYDPLPHRPFAPPRTVPVSGLITNRVDVSFPAWVV